MTWVYNSTLVTVTKLTIFSNILQNDAFLFIYKIVEYIFNQWMNKLIYNFRPNNIFKNQCQIA